MKEEFKRQVALTLDVLPEVSREDCFAMHGGTAINLFVRDMPRLSFDIDLTFVPVADRDSSFKTINTALSAIEKRVERVLPGVTTQHQEKELKLQVSLRGVQIKLEVNQINRGCLSEPVELMLCEKAQEVFDAFVSIKVVPESQLFGGKIIAALDRQHPRDLFDVKPMLQGGSLPDGIKQGLIFCLLSSNRPINEILNPRRIDQSFALEHQFVGLSSESFTYSEFELTRESLVKAVNERLTQEDKEFIFGFKRLEPDWNIYDFERFPAIQWKLENLRRFKQLNAAGYREAVDRLDALLQIV